jgi:leader peptidase (prepilin peptidase)/N-methyltransferase
VASDIHARAFGCTRRRSLLRLIAAGTLITNGGAICSVSQVVSTKVGLIWLSMLAGLTIVPGAALVLAGDDALSPLGGLVFLAVAIAMTAAAMVRAARLSALSMRWKLGRGPTFEVTNLASAVPGRGDARHLLDTVAAGAEQLGARLLLRVSPSNDRAIRLYRSAGYIEWPTPGRNNELVMERGATSNVEPAHERKVARFAIASSMVCAVGLIAAVSPPSAVVLVCVAAAAAMLGSAAVVDLRIGCLPNSYVLLAGFFGALACDAADTGVAPAVLGPVIAASPLLLMHLIDPSALGFGDVKFAAAAGVVVASIAWPAAVVVPLLALCIAVVDHWVRPAGPRPFGPALAIAVASALVVASLMVGLEVTT